MYPKVLGGGLEIELATIPWPLDGLDADACFVFGACRAAPVFPAAGTAGCYRPQQAVTLLREKNSQDP
jgi:hypothetical protein